MLQKGWLYAITIVSTVWNINSCLGWSNNLECSCEYNFGLGLIIFNLVLIGNNTFYKQFRKTKNNARAPNTKLDDTT